MEKVVTIDGKETRFVANGATPRLYRSMFQRDVFADMSKTADKDGTILSVEVFENLAYVMAKQGGLEMSIDDWLSSMSSPTAILEAVPEIFSLWAATTATIVPGKKK